MRTVFAPYTMAATSARALAEKFGSFCIRREGSRFRPRADDLIVNWGRSDLPSFPVGRVLNDPTAVAVSTNKLKTFHAFTEHNVPTVPWTQSADVAADWARAGDYVIGREKLSGSGGEGIQVFKPDNIPPGEIVPNYPCPLYTKYMKRKHEFRVHVFDGRVIDFTQKKLENGTEKNALTFIIRNRGNGWVFCREGVALPDVVANAAIAAVRACGLDFAGVDVGWNESKNAPYVFEVNTAPGIEGTTIERYYDALRAI